MGELRKRALVVDDEIGIRESVRVVLTPTYEVSTVSSGAAALEAVATERPHVVLLDILMPGMNGLEVLERLREIDAKLPVIMLTATKNVTTAVNAMKLGAFDYVTKPFDSDNLRILVERATANADLLEEVERLRHEAQAQFSAERLAGSSPRIAEIREMVRRIAPRKTTVLITGESGTGKELVARALHGEGPRARGPWVVLNCAAIPESLIESELFGHEKGAFTDAHSRQIGLFEQADHGTLFLDEIGEMPAHLQAKLLRVLEEERFTRVGGSQPLDVDVRVVAATNRDLHEAIREKRFRSDLFFRLNVVSLQLPPLRDRPEDLRLLATSFLGEKTRIHGLPPKSLTTDALDALLAYSWPGNVRELENTIERAVVLSGGRTELNRSDVEATLVVPRSGSALDALVEDVLQGRRSLGESVDAFEQSLIERGLSLTHYNQTRTAELLGTTRRILKYKIEKLDIDLPGTSEGPESFGRRG